MKWNEYRLIYRAMAELYGINAPVDETINRVLSRHSQVASEDQFRIAYDILRSEAHWAAIRRPYYNVWPSIMEAFSKIDLSKVDCSQLAMPRAALQLRFAKGHEFHGKIRSIFVAQLKNEHSQIAEIKDLGNENSLAAADRNSSRDFMIVMDEGTQMSDQVREGSPTLLKMPTHVAQSMRLTPGMTLEQAHQRVRFGPSVIDAGELVRSCLRLVCTLCLLDNNPDLIEDQPLEKDRERWEKTHDPALIERAHRKGKMGWDIGRKIEIAPGFRSPHFAIRWMGRGPDVVKKAVVRPIKGCLVRRGALLEVPTGYLDDEDAEEEVRQEATATAEAVCDPAVGGN